MQFYTFSCWCQAVKNNDFNLNSTATKSADTGVLLKECQLCRRAHGSRGSVARRSRRMLVMAVCRGY